MPAARPHRQRDRHLGNAGYEARLVQALGSVASGESRSLRQAATTLGVARSTLSDRAKSRHTSWESASNARQILTLEQEQVLLDWCRLRSEEARPWSPPELRAYAEQISGKNVGKKWHLKFERRHPEIRAARPAKLDPKRANNFNRTVVGDFFDKLEGLVANYCGIPPEHFWNQDEKGVQMGGGRKNSGKKFYFFKGQRNRYRLGSDNLELVTVMECISAAGDIMPPSFVLSEGPVPDLRHDLKEEDFGSLYTSQNGWSDDNHCKQWFKEVFIPNAKARMVDPQKPIILIMDGHGSHETLDMERVAYETMEEENIEIIIFCFPSKCTHKMQPLDVVVFSSVQKKWQQIAEKSVFDRVPIDRYNVIPLYVNGTRNVMTKNLVQEAFKKTGIYPLNRAVFTDEDFAPSQATSTIAHVPSSFPVDFPSSDPIEPDVEKDTPQTSDVDNMDYHSDSEDDSDSQSESHCDSTSELGSESDDGISVACTATQEAPSYSDTTPMSTPSADNHNSGLLITLGRIEERVGMVLTRSASQFSIGSKPPPVVSLHEDKLLSKQELLIELRRVRQELSTAHSAYVCTQASLAAAEAHCTIARQEVSNLREDLDKANKPRVRRGKTKVKARFITSKELFASFGERDAAEIQRQHAAEETAKKKAENTALENAQIAEDAVSRTFTGRLSSYKKIDLKALARAFHLSEQGTNDTIRERIDKHLIDEKTNLEKNSRFSQLYSKSSRSCQPQGNNQGDMSQSSIDCSPTQQLSYNIPQNVPRSLAQVPMTQPIPPQNNNHHYTSHYNPYYPYSMPQMSYNTFTLPYQYAHPALVHTAGGHFATSNHNSTVTERSLEEP